MADGSPPGGESIPFAPGAPRTPTGPSLFAIPWLGARRLVFALLVLGTAGMGTWMMLDIVDAGGITALEVGILLLFSATFAWIGIAFWHAILGFLLQALGRHPLTLRREGPPSRGATEGEPLRNRTALVMPAFNEHPQRLVAGLGAILRSLVATGEAHAFDLHLLSDTNDAALAGEEEESWSLLVEEVQPLLPPETGLHYRRRPTNTGRKAGNIAEFCRRSGSGYSYMVVLDADSLMRGKTLVGLVRAMDANPRAGLIQTVPLPVPQGTLFGRLLRFAATLHSPMLATGQSFWQGDTANYWGHNAIVRVDPFLAHGTLPVLPGRPPLGGEILSHDFVEAALLRRAGWQVLLLPEVEGSLEDVPGNIPDYARRDRRWAQGSLQHLRLLGMPGLHPVSRIHFLLGAMGYISSLLWLLMLLAATLYVVLPTPGAPLVGEGAVPTPSVLGLALGLPSLLVVTGAILFLPKVLALTLALVQRERREAFGGSLRLLVGALLELGFSVVLAPVMMMLHSRAVLGILMGQAVRWDPQNRYGERVGWGLATRQMGWITLAGLLWSGLTLAVSPLFFLWLTPIFAGLLLAVPLTVWTSGRRRRTGRARTPLFEVDAGWTVSLAPVLDATNGEGSREAGPMALSP